MKHEEADYSYDHTSAGPEIALHAQWNSVDGWQLLSCDIKVEDVARLMRRSVVETVADAVGTLLLDLDRTLAPKLPEPVIEIAEHFWLSRCPNPLCPQTAWRSVPDVPNCSLHALPMVHTHVPKNQTEPHYYKVTTLFREPHLPSQWRATLAEAGCPYDPLDSVLKSREEKATSGADVHPTHYVVQCDAPVHFCQDDQPHPPDGGVCFVHRRPWIVVRNPRENVKS